MLFLVLVAKKCIKAQLGVCYCNTKSNKYETPIFSVHLGILVLQINLQAFLSINIMCATSKINSRQVESYVIIYLGRMYIYFLIWKKSTTCAKGQIITKIWHTFSSPVGIHHFSVCVGRYFPGKIILFLIQCTF